MSKKNVRVNRWVRRRRPMRAAFTLLASGTLFATTCSSTSVQAVIDGVDAIASSLDRNIEDEGLSFGEWLLSELTD